jgi:TonB family protein
LSRLQKKCFLVSAGMHVLLPVILVLGSALSPRNKSEETQVLEFIPVMTTDDKVSGGGEPSARAAQAQLNRPVTPTPKPAEPPPPKVVERADDPDPPKDTGEAPAEAADSRKENKRKLPNVPTTPVARRTGNKPKTTINKTTPEDDSAREAQRTRLLAANMLGSAANSLRESATATEVKLVGPGGGGIPYANFLDTVRTVYTREWMLPEDIDDDQATTFASVTIDRKGNVVKKSISRKSGNPAVDSSVQRTLDRVTYVAPLPPNSGDEERTVTIGFNVKAKRGIG